MYTVKRGVPDKRMRSKKLLRFTVEDRLNILTDSSPIRIELGFLNSLTVWTTS